MPETEVEIRNSGWLWDGYWHEADNGKPFLNPLAHWQGLRKPCSRKIQAIFNSQ